MAALQTRHEIEDAIMDTFLDSAPTIDPSVNDSDTKSIYITDDWKTISGDRERRFLVKSGKQSRSFKDFIEAVRYYECL
jgi:hypothetical protein